MLSKLKKYLGEAAVGVNKKTIRRTNLRGMVNCWPIKVRDVPGSFDTPVSILAEQSHYLGALTRGDLIAKVEREKRHTVYGDVRRFLLTAPGINYRFELFHAICKSSGYPLDLVIHCGVTKELCWRTGIRIVKCEADFINDLRLIFSANRVIEILHNILRRVRQESEGYYGHV